MASLNWTFVIEAFNLWAQKITLALLRQFCAVEGGIPLSICANLGATNVVTPDRVAISNYMPFTADQGHVCVADKSSGSRAEGYGNLTLRS